MKEHFPGLKCYWNFSATVLIERCKSNDYVSRLTRGVLDSEKAQKLYPVSRPTLSMLSHLDLGALFYSIASLEFLDFVGKEGRRLSGKTL